jgi:segregation and condensation protein B
MTNRAEMEAVLEAILFVAPEPLPKERLLELFEEGEREEAAQALATVLERHRGGDDRGIMVEEVGGGLRLVSRPELHSYLKRFFQVTGRSRLSMPALETLAIIAYRQPLTGPEITDLRGAQSTTVIKTLLERRMIRIAGRKQVVGKPFLYATTREFLLHFGLGSLGDLPPLEEMEELFALEGGGEEPVFDREEALARESAALDEAAATRDEAGDEARGEARDTSNEEIEEVHEELREEAAEDAAAATFESPAAGDWDSDEEPAAVLDGDGTEGH